MVSHPVFISESSEQNTVLILKQDSSRNKARLFVTRVPGTQMRFAAYSRHNRDAHETSKYS